MSSSLIDSKANIFEKPENKFEDGKLSIKTGENIPKFKNPIELKKKDKETKDREAKDKQKKERKKSND